MGTKFTVTSIQTYSLIWEVCRVTLCVKTQSPYRPASLDACGNLAKSLDLLVVASIVFDTIVVEGNRKITLIYQFPIDFYVNQIHNI